MDLRNVSVNYNRREVGTARFGTWFDSIDNSVTAEIEWKLPFFELLGDGIKGDVVKISARHGLENMIFEEQMRASDVKQNGVSKFTAL